MSNFLEKDLFMCMIVLPERAYVFHVCLVPKEILVREGIRSPGSRVINKDVSLIYNYHVVFINTMWILGN